MVLEFIEFEACHFGVLDILPRSLAQQPITQEQALELAQSYAQHFHKPEPSTIAKQATLTALEPMLTRQDRLLILDDYYYRGGDSVLYNLGCVFCDLAQCASWDTEKTMRFLKHIYRKKVQANPQGWSEYAKALVEHTQALKRAC